MEKNFVNEREARVENNNTVVNTEAPATEAPQENSKKIFGMQPETAKKAGWWTLVSAGVLATGWFGYKLWQRKKKISAKKNAAAEADGKEKVENRGDEAK